MGETRVNGVNISVVQEGKVIRIPEGMALTDAYTAIGREIESQEENVAINAPIDGFLPDAAHAFSLAAKETFGYVAAKKNMFGDTSNASMSVAISPTETVEVPWGRFVVPGIAGYLSTEAAPDPMGRMRLVITGVVKRKNEAKVKECIELTKVFLRERSIYKGRAIELRLKDDRGNWLPMPEPTFVPINPKLRDELVFSADVQAAIEVSIFTPIEYRELLRESGIPLKSGILLYGPYGTGKSMTAGVTAALAVENGWTFIKAERADELADILRLARDYGPAVVFCEDVDQVVSGERSVNMNDLLNTIDGIESKDVELMVVLTTNHAEKINKAMLRAGRLDAAIHITPPDADAAERLMRHYGRSQVAKSEDLTEVANLMAGSNAGDVREVVERAKKATIRRTKRSRQPISAADLMLIAKAMHAGELDLRRELIEDTRSEQVKAATIVGDAIKAMPVVVPQEGHTNGHVRAAVAATTTKSPK